MSVEEGISLTPLIPSVAVYSQIPPPAFMNAKGNLADDWKYVKKSLNNYKAPTGLDKRDKSVVLATL